MKFDVKFKSIDRSQALVDYVQARCEKLEKFAIRPLTIHVTFSEERHHCKAQIYIHGFQGSCRASHASDSFHVSVDFCLKKIERQLEREKSRIKAHHHYEHTAEAQLTAMALQEERDKNVAWRAALHSIRRLVLSSKYEN